MALINKLNAIGDAIRAKNGATEKYSLDGMVEAIGAIETGGGELPEEAFLITGKCANKFSGIGWNWFIDCYSSRIKTSEITNGENMFKDNNELVSVPFAINFSKSNTASQSMFYGCSALEDLPVINGSLGSPYCIAKYCERIREVPESWATSIDWDTFNKTTDWSLARLSDSFYGCYSLRVFPETVLKRMYNSATSPNGGVSSMFYNCTTLDEIVGLRGINNTITSNMFSNTFSYCHRLKRLVFDTDNGAPRVENWKSQTIDLTSNVGVGTSFITTRNSGITDDK
jgi:hypothetical protein